MSIIYVNSVATGLNDGTSWTDAYTTLQAALTAWTVGDEIWWEIGSTEGTTTTTLTATDDTVSDRPPIYRMDSSDDSYSPTNGSDTKQFNLTTGGADLTWNCSSVIHGAHLSVSDNFDFGNSGTSVDLVDCKLESTTANGVISISGSSQNDPTTFINTTIDFTHTTGGSFNGIQGAYLFRGCTFNGYYGAAGAFRCSTSRTTTIVLESCDLSAANFVSSAPLFDISSAGTSMVLCRVSNCDVPSGMVYHDGGFANDNQVVLVEATDDAGNTYTVKRYTFRGECSINTSTYYGGTGEYIDADGNTPLSYEMIPSSDADHVSPLISIDMMSRIETTGSKTFTVQAVENFTTALTKRQVWIEVEHLGGSASSLWNIAHDREKAAGSYTNLSAGSGTGDWTSPPSGARSVAISATATINQAGLYRVRLFVGAYEAGKQFFFNPIVVVT